MPRVLRWGLPARAHPRRDRPQGPSAFWVLLTPRAQHTGLSLEVRSVVRRQDAASGGEREASRGTEEPGRELSRHQERPVIWRCGGGSAAEAEPPCGLCFVIEDVAGLW